MNAIVVEHLTKRFSPSAAPVLDSVSFTVPAGSFTCLLGPSGSGKSTILGCIAGLIEPDSGTIALDGTPSVNVAAHQRPVTLVLQSAQLFPFLTVGENVAFGLRVRKQSPRNQAVAARRYLSMVGLGDIANRSIKGLSAGEQQRVALARALAIEPSVLLLDEPLASLDPPVRRELQDLLADIHHRTETSIVLVTHDIDEAIALGDQLVIIDSGRIVASGQPAELYERPTSIAAARLLGCDNVIRGTANRTALDSAVGPLTVCTENALADSLAVRQSTWVIRPERVEVVTSTDDALAATVIGRRYQGHQTELRLQCGGVQLTAMIATRTDAPRPGESVFIRLPATHLIEVNDRSEGDPA
jgi:ABC-type Fe3+/spermidine/putrescine transport system ATPase subunit